MDASIIKDNPIFVREIRRRMRGRALIITMILYIAALCILAYVVIHWKSRTIAQQAVGQHYGQTTIADVGRTIYQLIIFLQSVLVLLVAPTLTAATLKSEKERETFDFLKVTSITPASYVLGSLLSTVLYVALALFCALPVLTIAYLYGGVSNVVSTTILLLCASMVLAAAGLLFSSAREKTRAGQGSVLFAILIVIMLMMSGTWLLRLPFGGGPSGATTVMFFGYAVPVWAFTVIGTGVITFLMLLIAARKIFDPAERALSYKQFGLLFFISLALPCIYIIYRAGMGGGTGNGFSLLTAVYVVLSLAMQNTFLLNRVEIGNERWRVKKQHPHMREKDEALTYIAAMQLAGAALITLMYVSIAGTSSVVWYFLAPAVAYLALHAGICNLLLKRVEDEFRSLKFIVAFDAILLIVPPILGKLGTYPSLAVFSDIVGAFSPITASNTLRLNTSGTGILTAAFFMGLALLVWMAAKRTKPRHELADPHYELAL